MLIHDFSFEKLQKLNVQMNSSLKKVSKNQILEHSL